jgi:hypothetical protein
MQQKYLSPETRNFFVHYFSQAKNVLMTPRQFFQNMPTDGNWSEPAIFCALSIGFAALVTLLMSFNLLMMLLVFFSGMIGIGIVSVVAYYLSKVMHGQGSLEATYRVFAYSSAGQLLAWIPLIGFLVVVYSMAINFFGIKQVHNLSNGKTIAVILISGILSVVVMCTVGVTLFLKQLFHF